MRDQNTAIGTGSPAIELRSINSLLTDAAGQPMRYLIPAYQRGYRWGRQQVTQLLDDIWEFVQSGQGMFYCLQPVVVQKREGICHIVDGQQRLTTLFILLSHRKPILELISKKLFQISYETRELKFLEDIDLARADENVDFHHICEAWAAIDDWVKGRDGTHALKLVQHILNDDEAGRNVRVIWYELSQNDDPVAAFTRLNVGKIPLTEAELVRALFLRRATKDDNSGNLALRIAYEWDQIETRLQDDAFWYFLQNVDGGDANRIGLIFQLSAMTSGAQVGSEEFGAFIHFASELSEPGSADRVWQRVKETFMAFDEWFEDRELFHILGFTLNQPTAGLQTLQDILSGSRTAKKGDFLKGLRGRAYWTLFGETIDGRSREDIDERTRNLCTSVSYESVKDRDKIRNLLLLFNLATLLENRKSNIRFQFHSFKTESWDLEHIRSQSDARPNNQNAQDEWLRHCREYLAVTGGEGAADLAKRISTYLNSELREREHFEELDDTVLKFFQEDEGDPIHSLANLTLLDARTNRGYRNAVFAVKRSILLANDRTGVFVPLCTRNAFLKCYSSKVGDALIWKTHDADAYFEAIVDTLTRFFLAGAEVRA